MTKGYAAIFLIQDSAGNGQGLPLYEKDSGT